MFKYWLFSYILILSFLGCAPKIRQSDSELNAEPVIVKPKTELQNLQKFSEPNNEPEFEKAKTYIEPLKPKEAIKDIRVQIFPHLGAYATPQKAEKQLESIRFESKGICTLSFVDRPTDIIDCGNSITVEYAIATEALLLQCEEPATLVREQGLKNYKYSGNFEIKAVPAGKNPRHLQVVNVNSFEAYLKGVVPSEVFSSWPLETLKAQAVAARTYAYAQILNERKKKAKLLESNAIDDKSLLFDVDDTVSYQAYSGILPDTKLTDQAVEETVGEVMLFNGKIIVAYFSADSGGFTESAENVWGKAVPYCQSKSEKYE